MKALLGSLQSFFGLFHQGKKPSSSQTAHADDAGYGASASPLLRRQSKARKLDRQGKQLSHKSPRQGSSLRHCRRRIHSLIARTNSESNPSPAHCNMSPIKSNSPQPASMAACTESLNQSTGLRNCPVRRRTAARKHADEAFDKHTSEYYSCGKKGMQNRGLLACEFPNVINPGDVNVSANSSTSDSDVSESSSGEGNVSTQFAQPIRLCRVSWRPMENGCVDCVERGKVSGLSIILTENKALIDNFYHCISEASPTLNTIDDHNTDVQVQKMGVGVLPTLPIEKRDHLHDRSSEYDVGFCSQHEYDEEIESDWDRCGMSSYSLSLARGNLRKKFPPPLSMLALQSHSDKRGQSPEACAAGHCLRSYRQDGRFVLQEVRAPTHKYFHVLREDGRLKLELINAVDDSSLEDDATSAPDICVGVHVDVHSLCDEMNIRAGSNAGCVRMQDLTSICRANVGAVEPLEQDELAAQPHIQRNLEVMVDTANTLHDVGASADERIPQAHPMFANNVGAEVMVSPLTEPPASPRCPDMKTVYDGTSTSIKRSWVRPISAF